jgi:hypothetical protein
VCIFSIRYSGVNVDVVVVVVVVVVVGAPPK